MSINHTYRDPLPQTNVLRSLFLRCCKHKIRKSPWKTSQYDGTRAKVHQCNHCYKRCGILPITIATPWLPWHSCRGKQPLTTSQYISVHLSTSQYISVHLSTSQYISLHLSTSQYISVYLSTSQYISLHLSTSQYISVYLSTSQYISV